MRNLIVGLIALGTLSTAHAQIGVGKTYLPELQCTMIESGENFQIILQDVGQSAEYRDLKLKRDARGVATYRVAGEGGALQLGRPEQTDRLQTEDPRVLQIALEDGLVYGTLNSEEFECVK